VSELGRPEVRDGADSQGPPDRVMREKRPAQKARTKRENVLPQRRHARAGWAGERGFGLRGQRGQQEPAGPKAKWAARSAGPKVRKKIF
jgi:hypothetical protein